jgi:X-X-X-Leu-X-X-Gly heptad repeat protein
MNKTLLLIICDFLLLNLLALTRWEKLEPVPTQKAPVPELKANAAAAQNRDLVGLMKLALEDERATREQLQQRLQFTESDVKTREQSLAQIQAQKARLESSLAQSQQTLAAKQAEAERRQQALAALEQEKKEMQQQALNLSTAVKEAHVEKDVLREQMEKQLQQALAEKQAEIERQQQALAALEKQRNAAILQSSNLATAVTVAETERNLLRENVSHLKGEVSVVRKEKEQLQAQTAKLSDGVTQLAAKSGELTKEIRENTPINMNLMFGEFLSNRVDVTVSALVPGLFGSSLRVKEAKTVLVQDGATVYALLHVNETPFSLIIPAYGMSVVSARVSQSRRELAKGPVQFWAGDPRVVIVPVGRQPTGSTEIKIYSTARNPFKFTEAVLISRGGKYYGEVEFKLDARTPDYVRMKNRLFSRMFGEFSPSAGDLVLSKTGEFLGIMVNSDYCAVVKSFETHPSDNFDESTMAAQMRSKLEELRTRIDKLPFALR